MIMMSVTNGLKDSTVFPIDQFLFHKEPIIAISCDKYPSAILVVSLYKKSAKQMLIDQQSSSDNDLWPKFILYSTQCPLPESQ